MNDETYDKLVEMEQGIPMVAKSKDKTLEDRITVLENTILKQEQLIGLCLEAVERFGSQHQTSYKSFLEEFQRIRDGEA